MKTNGDLHREKVSDIAVDTVMYLIDKIDYECRAREEVNNPARSFFSDQEKIHLLSFAYKEYSKYWEMFNGKEEIDG